MDPPVRCYLHQAGRCHCHNGIGPIYSNPTFLQRFHGIGNILVGLWRSFVRPLLWHSAKTVGSEAIGAGRNILKVMTDPDTKFRDVVLRNVRDTAHRVLKRLSGQGRKRKSGKGGIQTSRVNKNEKDIKRDIFS